MSRGAIGRRIGLVLVLLVTGLPSQPVLGQTRDTYINPVSKSFADTFADPAVIRAKDGFWYAYGTSDPLREGDDQFHLIPMARSADLVSWEYVGDAFRESNAPSWMAVPEIWAPDIRYFDGKYHLYYVVTDTIFTDSDSDTAIGVATAPTPMGPWTDSGAPVVGPRPAPEEPGEFLWTLDPSQFTDRDGTRYLYYGSYFGGIFVRKLSRSGTRAVGEETRVTINDRYEGAYVIRRGRFYYLFASAGNCCAGPTTGYTTFVGRSRSPLGPFVDEFGTPMTASRAGGSIVVSPNGNRWIGTGHNAVVTDLSGQDWLVYHAIARGDPFLDEPFDINERPTLIDRLDWIDGWPVVRRGKWASQGRVRAPVAQPSVGGPFGGAPARVGSWHRHGGNWDVVARARQSFVDQRSRSCDGAFLTGAERAPVSLRAEADLRVLRGREGKGAAGLVLAYRDSANYIVAWLNRATHGLVTNVLADGERLGRTFRSLPDGFRFNEWHNLAVEIRGTTLTAEVTDARLNDPQAVQTRQLPSEAVRAGAIGVASRCAQAQAANLGASRLYQPVRDAVPVPAIGAVDPAFSDEFDDGSLDPTWSWVRSPDGDERNGVFRWPTQDADLFEDVNSASVLLRDAPAGRYTVETKLDINTGTKSDRSFEQAGLVVYVHDDLNLRMDHTAILNTRQTEFGKEMPFAEGLSYGAMAVGTPQRVTWLRVRHTIDPNNGEHEFRAASSRNGVTWTWGGVWTLPARTTPRIGLVSMGGPGAIARFHYFRVRRST
jgi:arabinan endo-1,5-alpha-L-arabinosidase